MPESLQEVLDGLRRIETALNIPPVIDPTANVLSLVAAAMKRQDDLREQAEKFTDKLWTERSQYTADARKAEAGRIDALLAANTQNVALALEKQGTQASAQDRRIAVLEQNQYSTGGGTAQRTESRQQYQWAIGIAILIIAFVVGHFWK